MLVKTADSYNSVAIYSDKILDALCSSHQGLRTIRLDLNTFSFFCMTTQINIPKAPVKHPCVQLQRYLDTRRHKESEIKGAF